jgi:hypothetical protein
MTMFRDILSNSTEELLKVFYVFDDDEFKVNKTHQLDRIARKLRLRTEQLICAIGFNPNLVNLTEIIHLLGYTNIDEVVKKRNELFISDIYKKISLDNILTLYNVVKDHPETLQVMQYLVEQRLRSIESKIEATVNSIIIEKYKAEIRAIYLDGIAGIDFAEMRLDKIDSGFRALLNEVTIITESRIIPAGDIFFRDTVLPQEKRKLLNKGLIPLELVHARLEDETISQREKKMLQEYLSITGQNSAGTT